MNYEYYFLGFLICLYAPYFVWAILSFIVLAEDNKKDQTEQEPTKGWPLVTVAVPMFNEGDQFVASLDALLSIEYPNLEIIVVDDGSTDFSFDVAQKRFGVLPHDILRTHETSKYADLQSYHSSDYPTLNIYRQTNQGKAAALNTALHFAKGKYFLTLDADSIPGRFSIKRMVKVLESESNLVGVSGVVRLSNGCTISNGEIQNVHLSSSWLARFQTLEYLRSFLISRIGMHATGGLIILSGAFSLLRTEEVRSINGFNEKCIGEDFEICIRLITHGKKHEPRRLGMLSNANCWTSAPENLRVLYRQRERWQIGSLETMWTHRKLLFKLKNMRLSWIGMPTFLLFEAFTPVYELFGIIFVVYMLIHLSFDLNAAFLILGGLMSVNVIASLIAILSETFRPGMPARFKDIVYLTFISFLEPLLYRPLNAMPRITGTFKFLFSTKQVWGDMERSNKSQ